METLLTGWEKWLHEERVLFSENIMQTFIIKKKIQKDFFLPEKKKNLSVHEIII